MTLKISRSQVSTQPNRTQPMDEPNPWPTLRIAARRWIAVIARKHAGTKKLSLARRRNDE